VRQVVAGVEDEVRLEAVQRTHPVLLAPLRRGEVQVGDLQDAHGVGARRQDGTS
jgi:hypothetical protein